MANTLQIKRSTTATNTPTLAAGELGVNIADQKLWLGDGTNNYGIGVLSFWDSFVLNPEIIVNGFIYPFVVAFALWNIGWE